MTSFKAQQIPYAKTNAFSAIVKDYVAGAVALQPFYQQPVNIEGIKNAIAQRKKYAGNRQALVAQLNAQYNGLTLNKKLQENIDSLLQENTFTITTAHQPNIFTGHLYFVYKILHAVKLAAELKLQLPAENFVPVYYMGSEDADLEELGEITINGKKYTWQTQQNGAVGRMKVDKAFIHLITEIEGQLSVEPFGNEILGIVKKAYCLDKTIEQATFEMVHDLFAAFGLVVLLPDNAALKKEFSSVIEKEIKEQFSNKQVIETMKDFPETYKIQTAGREINLFYLKDDIRERIEKLNGHWVVVNTDIRFTAEAIFEELQAYPERFSPNVILRPVFQEHILPNIVFIGGGGELAYWLELKAVFNAVQVPYPVLVLRNSFMLANKKQVQKISALQLQPPDFFTPENELVQGIVEKSSAKQLKLTAEKNQLSQLYQQITAVSTAIDPSLEKHTAALHTLANKKIEQLEKKMLKAEKKKFEAQQRQISKIRSVLFPNNNLQERVDNIMPYYAVYGKAFIEELYKHSLSLEQEFCILTEEG